MRGTPKTLNGAIQNAFHEFENEKGSGSVQRLKKLIKLHVQDWIRNAIMPLASDDVTDEEEIKAISRLIGRKF